MDIEWSRNTNFLIGHNCIVNKQEPLFSSPSNTSSPEHCLTLRTESSLPFFSNTSTSFRLNESLQFTNTTTTLSPSSLMMTTPTSEMNFEHSSSFPLCSPSLQNTQFSSDSFQSNFIQNHSLSLSPCLNQNNDSDKDTSFAPLTPSLLTTRHSFLSSNSNQNVHHNLHHHHHHQYQYQYHDATLNNDEDNKRESHSDSETTNHKINHYVKSHNSYLTQDSLNSLLQKHLTLNSLTTDSVQTLEPITITNKPSHGHKRKSSHYDDEDKTSVSYVSRQIKRMHLTSTDESNFGITLTVKTLMGRSLHIKIEPQEKISTLKQRLAAISGVPQDQQRLIYNGKTLADGRTFYDYSMKDGALIHMVLAVSGG